MSGRLLALGLWLCCAHAQAWGGSGHRIVAELAERYLTDDSRAAVARLLGGKRLADVANWADEYREACPNTGPWHYVNIPLAAARYDEARVCPEPKSCVVRAIEQARALLADTGRPDADRAFALALLVHFVGDLHQPLHSGDRADRGGTQQYVRFADKPQTLHAFWDHELIRFSQRSDSDYIEHLASSLKPALRDTWQKGTVSEWALEAKRAARLAYSGIPEGSRLMGATLPMTIGRRRSAAAPTARDEAHAVPLTTRYAREMLPIVDRQLARAAVRLAKTLNDAFEHPGPAPESTASALQACTVPVH